MSRHQVGASPILSEANPRSGAQRSLCLDEADSVGLSEGNPVLRVVWIDKDPTHAGPN